MEEIVKLKESVSSKEKEIENLEKVVNENEERLKKYEDDLINLRSQIESKDSKIKSLEGRNSELQDEKNRVSNLLKENKIRIDDYNVQISVLHQDNDKKDHTIKKWSHHVSTLNEKIEKYKSQIAKLEDEIKKNNNIDNQMNNKKHEIEQSLNQLKEISNEKENTIKCLQEQIQSLKEDINHYRSKPNNKENILEHTDHNYLGNHQTQNTLHANVNDHKYHQPEKNICQNLTENIQDQQANNTQNHEAIIMLPTGAVGRIIGKKGNKVRHLQTKNNVSITTTKQTEDNQKLTIKGSIPNIQTTIDEIKQITQCKYSNTCTFGLNCKFNHEQLNIVEFYKGLLPKDRSETNKNPNTVQQANTIHFNIEDTQKNIQTNQIKDLLQTQIENQIKQILQKESTKQIIQKSITQQLTKLFHQ